MTGRRLRPPEGGDEAPKVSSPLDGGETLDLVVLATAICERYGLEYPDERERHEMPVSHGVCTTISTY